MPKIPTNQSLPAKAATQVQDAVRALDLLYCPADDERRLKAQFYAALEENPVCDRDEVTVAAVIQLTGDGRVSAWWGKPGFREWFCNKDEFKAKCDFALDLLLDSFVEIARSDDPKSFGAKVQAAKLLAELRGHTGKGVKTKVLDGEIPTDPDELEAYVDKLEATRRKAK